MWVQHRRRAGAAAQAQGGRGRHLRLIALLARLLREHARLGQLARHGLAVLAALRELGLGLAQPRHLALLTAPQGDRLRVVGARTRQWGGQGWVARCPGHGVPGAVARLLLLRAGRAELGAHRRQPLERIVALSLGRRGARHLSPHGVGGLLPHRLERRPALLDLRVRRREEAAHVVQLAHRHAQ